MTPFFGHNHKPGHLPLPSGQACRFLPGMQQVCTLFCRFMSLYAPSFAASLILSEIIPDILRGNCHGNIIAVIDKLAK
jgi:hypothetical protein